MTSFSFLRGKNPLIFSESHLQCLKIDPANPSAIIHNLIYINPHFPPSLPFQAFSCMSLPIFSSFHPKPWIFALCASSSLILKFSLMPFASHSVFGFWIWQPALDPYTSLLKEFLSWFKIRNWYYSSIFLLVRCKGSHNFMCTMKLYE